MENLKKKKKDRNQNINNYFYSTKKDKEGNVKFDYKNFAKEGFKYTKWAFYLFLLVVSLWGCFQSFVIVTNPQLGYGLELYQKEEDVYANNYTFVPEIIIPVENIHGYSSSEDANNKIDVNNDGDVDSVVPNLLYYTEISTGTSESNLGVDNSSNSIYYSSVNGLNALNYYSYFSSSLNTGIIYDDNDPSTTEDKTWSQLFQEYYETDPIKFSQFENAYTNSLNAFLNPSAAGVEGAKLYLRPSPISASIAPTNISYYSSQYIRTIDDSNEIHKDNVNSWVSNDAKDSERNNKAGWSFTYTTSNNNLNNPYSQTEFASDSDTLTNATIEEYFMIAGNDYDEESGNWSWDEAGAYYVTGGSFSTGQSINSSGSSLPSGITSYAVASDLPDYSGKQSISEVQKEQQEIAENISKYGLIARDINDINNMFGSIDLGDDEELGTEDDIYNKGSANNGSKDSLVFATPIGTTPGVSATETMEAKEASEELYFISFGGVAYQKQSSSSTIDWILSDSFDNAVSAYGSFTTSDQIENRNIMISWDDAWEYGPFYGLFVWPISQFSLWVSSWITWATFGAWSAILGTIFIVLLLRFASTLLTVNKFTSQAKTQEIQLKTAEVNAKYAIYDKKNKEMQRKKQAETMAIYKKEGVSPYGSIGTLLLTMPIFLSMWRVISALPAYKIGEIAGVGFGQSTLSALLGGAAASLLIMIPVVFVQYISYKCPTWLAKKRKGVKHIDEKTKKAMKKNNKIANIMGIVFIFIGLTIPSLLAIYWIMSGLYTIIISFAQHMVLVRQAENTKLERMGTSRKEEIQKGNMLSFNQKLANIFLPKDKERKVNLPSEAKTDEALN